MREILDIFLRESTEKERELRRAVDQSEGHEAAVALHAIANLVSHVHALEAMEKARRLERDILDGKEAEAFEGARVLLEEFGEISRAVKEFRKTLD
ncbi:Hpt domain-containing protein [Salidesulfovibrio brasiliensis]|uniref:Hpt domain-containing protein n=1 Tax=Salidesulfovibrio brasiliensis TaxID=221711 RepID=UPI0006D1F083|nr:Hpt domain-containing protein [Salidesulfovibrio brasiliensis]